MEISAQLANQIVSSAQEVIKNDINLIDGNGMIIGSTKIKRIGSFHEAGFEAATKNHIVTVTKAKETPTVQEGINYPIHLDKDVVAVIGITGNPKIVSSYGFLVTKITEIFLKEQQIQEKISSKEGLISSVMTALIQNNIANKTYFITLLDKLKLSVKESYQICALFVKSSSYIPSLKHSLYLKDLDTVLYIYPDELILLLPESKKSVSLLSELITEFKDHIIGGVGDYTSLYQVHRSYEQAILARAYGKNHGHLLTYSKDISGELILTTIPEDMKASFVFQMLGSLDEKARHVLRVYLEHNQSLKETSQLLDMHKNTLQYQLDQITKSCGFNPRIFQDAFYLKLALLLL